MPSGDQTPVLTEVTETQRQEAMARFRVLRSRMLSVTFLYREPHLRPVYRCEPPNAGWPGIVPQAWPDSHGCHVRTSANEKFPPKL
jgi:hypothetical protein